MKLKLLLPLAFAFAAQAFFSPPSHGRAKFSQKDFAHKRDSVNLAIKEMVNEHFENAEPDKPIIKELDPAALSDSDSNSYIRLEGYAGDTTINLRQEILEHGKDKKGFVYLDNMRSFLLPMQDAEQLVAAADLSSRQNHSSKKGYYLKLTTEPLMALARAGIDGKTGPNDAFDYNLIAGSRLLQTIGHKAIPVILAHEDGHEEFDFVELFSADDKDYTNAEKDSLKRISEYGADQEAIKHIGRDKFIQGITSIYYIFTPQPQDDYALKIQREAQMADELSYETSGDHPTLAQRAYVAILQEEYQKNKKLAEIYESLMPPEFKAAIKLQKK